jgi:hypothetical protein
MYIRKINDFTNQSYYNSSYFTNYNIHEVYYITVTNISNSHNVIFNLSGFSDNSKARIFKAPFNDVIITYSNDSIYTPTITGNTANITVSSFSIFVVLEDTTVVPVTPVSGGGGGGGSGGGGGGAGPIMTLNQTPVKNNTIVNVTQNITEVNKTVEVKENITITTIEREKILKPYVDSLKENYLLIIWASLFLAVLAITSGYAAKSIQYRKYSRLNKDEKLQYIKDRFELASELLNNSRTATHEDKLKVQLLRARIAGFVSKESEIMISEFDAVYKELERLFKKYEE